jgi:hypothetical protein
VSVTFLGRLWPVPWDSFSAQDAAAPRSFRAAANGWPSRRILLITWLGEQRHFFWIHEA